MSVLPDLTCRQPQNQFAEKGTWTNHMRKFDQEIFLAQTCIGAISNLIHLSQVSMATHQTLCQDQYLEIAK